MTVRAARVCVPMSMVVALAASCERTATEVPADVRLEAPDDADADYPPTCSELGPATCSAPCSQGEAAACLHLAEGYLEGAGLPRDPKRALGLMRGACDDGFARACGYLAMSIGRADRRESRALATRGCERGYGGACVWLVGEHLLDATPIDWAGAAPWLARGCTAGHAESCLLIGDLQRTGVGVQPDADAARSSYARACEGGYADACELAEGAVTGPVLHEVHTPEPEARDIRDDMAAGSYRAQTTLCVDPTGSVTITAIEADPGFAELVRRSLARWRFTPPGATESPPCIEREFGVTIVRGR